MEKYNKLLKAITDNKLTVNKLSKITGIHSQDLYNAINGRKEFFEGWKKRIASALNTTVEELFPNNEGDAND